MCVYIDIYIYICVYLHKSRIVKVDMSDYETYDNLARLLLLLRYCTTRILRILPQNRFKISRIRIYYIYNMNMWHPFKDFKNNVGKCGLKKGNSLRVHHDNVLLYIAYIYIYISSIDKVYIYSKYIHYI